MANQVQQPVSYTAPFEGRMGRRAFVLGIVYWLLLFLIPVMFAQMLVRFALTSSGATGNTSPILMVFNIVSLLFGLAATLTVIPLTISLYIRRLHDVNQTGLFAFLMLVPFANLFLFIYLIFTPGTNGKNNYGAPVTSTDFWVVLGIKKA